MSIEYLITLCERRLVQLGSAKTAAESIGDIERVLSLASEIVETETTLAQLRSIQGAA